MAKIMKYFPTLAFDTFKPLGQTQFKVWKNSVPIGRSRRNEITEENRCHFSKTCPVIEMRVGGV